jgi:hypothetical protein
MGITEMVITKIITTEIMEIDKEVIWSVSIAWKKDIRRMTIHYIWNQQLKHENKNSQPKVGVNVVIVE